MLTKLKIFNFNYITNVMLLILSKKIYNRYICFITLSYSFIIEQIWAELRKQFL